MIVDAHAHLETSIYGVTPDPERKRMPKLLMWSFEVMGFQNPLWRGAPRDRLEC